MKLTGMMTTKNIGIAVKITTTVPRTLVDMLNKSLMFIGIWVSTMSTSLENLFRILPRGVVSKKDIGDLITLSNIVLCSFRAALRVNGWFNEKDKENEHSQKTSTSTERSRESKK